MTARSLRVLVALVSGCAWASALTTAGLALLNLTTGNASSSDAVLAYLAWFALSFVVTSIFAGTIGLAWHTFCQTNGWTSAHWYWSAGALTGAASGALWYLPAGAVILAIFLTVYGAVLGGMTGYFAWRARRPDRDAPNPPTQTP